MPNECEDLVFRQIFTENLAQVSQVDPLEEWLNPRRTPPCHMGNQYERDCAFCRRRLRAVYRKYRKPQYSAYPLLLPLCERCGNAHTRTYWDGCPTPQCDLCDAKTSVETFWRLRAVFDGNDDEEIMDRIQKSHPHLFELGILPQYWFELRIAHEQL